jgi:apolipoprotein N-acyltransferase
MIGGKVKAIVPGGSNALLAVVAAVLLILAFPDFDLWPLAFVGLVPLLIAVGREERTGASFVLGWIFGIVFFFGTSWWLTFAPITYAAFPPALAYFLLLCVTMIVAVFPGVFAAVTARLVRAFGPVGMLAVPFVWTATEFARYWLTGNNWNALGYSQAFTSGPLQLASVGGIYLVSFAIASVSAFMAWSVMGFAARRGVGKTILVSGVFWLSIIIAIGLASIDGGERDPVGSKASKVIAIQPNVPMSGLGYEKWLELRSRHVEMAEGALDEIRSGELYDPAMPVTVVFPESPMNFRYDEDLEFQSYIHAFARRNNVTVLFNSAEPNHADNKYYNSAVLVGPEGNEIGQYDKIYLVPFGEFVPAPVEMIVPAFVGSFSAGADYRLLPIGEARAGVMICFESHFGELTREYARQGADVIIEMTNDGYLGPTPVLRQHLANAVFRAVETNRPVLRVTNVGITAYITQKGEVVNPAPSYAEDVRVWDVPRSDGSQTLYVRFGDWFAWLSLVVTLGLVIWGVRRRAK